VSDSGKMLAAPVDWGGREWLTLGGIAVATYGLFQVDAEVRNYFQRNQSSGADRFASVGNALGNPLFIVPPLGALYLFGSFTDDVTARRAALLSVESLVISGLFTQGIKVLAERHRPFTGDSSGTWDGPKMKNFNSSFPSGHTTSAFSVASVVAEEYGANPLVPPVAYGLATLTGLSRIYGDYHWASDTFVGAVLGYVVGKAVVRFHPAGGERRVMVLPVYSQKWQGVSVSVRF
jgi:membrane-associated phospholipid phosphatase